MSRAQITRYSGVAITLHWLIALLLIGQLAGGFYMHGLPREQAELKFELYQLHKSFGITILLLTLLRILWRLTHTPPPLPDRMPEWEKFLARAAHFGFYALLIALPLVGWAVVSSSPFAESVQTYLFGVIHWPHLPFFQDVADRRALSDEIAEIHEYLAFAMIGLIGLHLAAVVKHAFLDRDSVLSHMVPFVKGGA
jgi:cytochrome b561